MSLNPHFLHPTKGTAWAEGFWVAFFATSSPEPSSWISEEDYDAFNEGVAAGIEAGRDGYPISEHCVELRESEPSGLTIVSRSAGIAMDLVKVATKGAAGVLGLVVSVIRFAVSGQTYFYDPEVGMAGIADELIQTLQAYGLDNVSVFVGGGVDRSVRDCELFVTRVFPTLEQARQGAISIGRPEWLVLEWRTNQSNGIDIAASSYD